MRLKELFTAPEGQKVTEKVFGKVLISSVCSILLTMTCLFGTTWAWFTVSVENNDNVIQIATVSAQVTVTGNGQTETADGDGVYRLEAGTYAVHMQLTGDRTATDSPVYVLAVVGTDRYYYLAFENGSTEESCQLELPEAAAVSFRVTWVKPDTAVSASRLPQQTDPEETTAPTLDGMDF